MKNLIPKEFCLACDVCCRFLEERSLLRPIFLKEERRDEFKDLLDSEGHVILKKYNSLYICPFFLPEKNICSIYEQRPIDCRLYPFIITYNENKGKTMLCLDTTCPYAKDKMAPQGDYEKLCIRDKKIFDEEFKDSESFYYSFVNFYIWKGMTDIWWRKTNGKIDILLGQGGNLIEFDKIKKYKEYIYLREELSELKGGRFKHKRSSFNFFVKNYNYAYLPYEAKMKGECLKLFSKWAQDRKQKYKDLYYHRLIDDSLSAQKIAMEEFEELGLIGRVVKIEGVISAYTFGYQLNKETFCILFEITDLKFKGLSQFIFREFCKELTKYKYINLMDDSGLENLRRVKKSYRPIN